MMSVAVVGILALVGPPMMVQVQRFFLQSQSRASIQRDAREALTIINRLLRQAKSSTLQIDSASGQPPYSRVQFTTTDGRAIMFWQEGTTLYQRSASGSTAPLSKNLRFIAFTMPRSDDPTIMSVSMTMEKATYQGGAKALELTIQKVRIMN